MKKQYKQRTIVSCFLVAVIILEIVFVKLSIDLVRFAIPATCKKPEESKKKSRMLK